MVDKTWFLERRITELSPRLVPYTASSRILIIQVSALISQRIELQSMLRCLNDRINEPDIFYYRFWEIGALFRYVCRGKAHFALL